MGFKCDHGIGKGCAYCNIQKDYRRNSGIHGIIIGISHCAEILKKAESVEEALESIKQLDPDKLCGWA